MNPPVTTSPVMMPTTLRTTWIKVNVGKSVMKCLPLSAAGPRRWQGRQLSLDYAVSAGRVARSQRGPRKWSLGGIAQTRVQRDGLRTRRRAVAAGSVSPCSRTSVAMSALPPGLRRGSMCRSCFPLQKPNRTRRCSGADEEHQAIRQVHQVSPFDDLIERTRLQDDGAQMVDDGALPTRKGRDGGVGSGRRPLLLHQRSCIPRPARMWGVHFSIRAALVADCFAPVKWIT